MCLLVNRGADFIVVAEKKILYQLSSQIYLPLTMPILGNSNSQVTTCIEYKCIYYCSLFVTLEFCKIWPYASL